MACKYRKVCRHYHKDSYTCNRDEGPYCGMYREFNKKLTVKGACA